MTSETFLTKKFRKSPAYPLKSNCRRKTPTGRRLEYLFPKNTREWDENKLLFKALNDLDHLAKSKPEQQSLPAYLSKRTTPVKKLFSFFQNRVKEDIESGKKVSVAGNDFNKQAWHLANVANEIHAIFRESDFSIADQLQAQGSKYQATILIDKSNYTIQGMAIFLYGYLRPRRDQG